jgi:hypothetical protein
VAKQESRKKTQTGTSASWAGTSGDTVPGHAGDNRQAPWVVVVVVMMMAVVMVMVMVVLPVVRAVALRCFPHSQHVSLDWKHASVHDESGQNGH